MYFPKSQIKTNLYTSGDEFNILGSNTFYIGHYYSVSNGKFYTGKNPNSGENFELVPNNSPFTNDLNSDLSLIDNEDVNEITVNIVKSTDKGDFDVDSTVDIPLGVDWEKNQKNNYEYYNLKQTTNRLIPPPFTSTLTNKERRKGKYTRYYVKNIKDVSYYEISEETFKGMSQSNLYANDLYEAIFLHLLIGKKYNSTNHLKFLTIEFRRGWKGFSTLSPFQLSKSSLYTDGGEFLLPNRTNYIGYYHSMSNGEFMTGKYHGDGPEIVLIPLKSNLSSSSLPTNSGRGSSGGGGY